MQAFHYPEVYRDETAVSTALAGAAPRHVAAAGPCRGGSPRLGAGRRVGALLPGPAALRGTASGGGVGALFGSGR